MACLSEASLSQLAQVTLKSITKSICQRHASLDKPSTKPPTCSDNSSNSWRLRSSETSQQTTASDAIPPSVQSVSTIWSGEPCKPPIKIVLGTASVGSSASPLARITSTRELQDFTARFRARGYSDIDTARCYPVGRGGTCERMLGHESLKLATWANLSTKVASFIPGSHRAKNIARSIDQSLEALSMDAVDILYLHAPDRATPLLETCKAMDEAYRQGKFERFGLSNYSVDHVREIVALCQDHGFVMPSVYQGQYNPVCRDAEAGLFTLLRQFNIAFYAYSPSACGFFSGKVTRNSVDTVGSRWTKATPLGAKYARDYFHDTLFAVAASVIAQAQAYGITGHAAALRWSAWHSSLAAEHRDAIIVGASSLEQLQENLEVLEQGPLPGPLLETFERAWLAVQASQAGPRCALV